MISRCVFFACLLGAAGCCCNPLSGSADESEWTRAVAREKANPQSPALEAGTANVFTLELETPERGQAEQDVIDERVLRLEVARLEVELSEARLARGVFVDPETLREQRGLTPEAAAAAWAPVLEQQRRVLAEVQAEPAAPAAVLSVSERYHFVVLYPAVPMLEEAGFVSVEGCAPCINAAAQRKAVFMRSFGWAGVDLRTVSHAALVKGVVLPGPLSIGSVGERDHRRVELPTGARATLRLERSCPATVVQVSDTLTVDTGAGVIAVPRREERSWTELRDAPCATPDGVVREQLRAPLEFHPERSPTRVRLFQLKAMREHLDR